MPPLANGLDYIDLNFLGQPGIIATAILHGPGGVALIDPGPSTTLPHLTKALADRGFAPRDIRAILLTHIHLDHAGCTGVLIDDCPNATVYVHERGAPHMIDPSKLIASASRLYAPDMEWLWGEIRPVPANRVRIVGRTELGSAAQTGRTEVQSALRNVALHLDPITVVGHELQVAWTPGHAWHHVSYYSPAAKIAFVGDTAGICRPIGRVVLPPTPPPDIDLEAWRTSTDLILAWNPDVLFLTHFGPQSSPRVHVQDLWKRMEEWSRLVRALLAQPGTDDDHARAFTDAVMDDLVRATSRDEARAYASAARFDFSWTGLARYWSKRRT
jgi:glyoxylase-like metal-dependent hydrolase (beta-lactamase superfamily II)